MSDLSEACFWNRCGECGWAPCGYWCHEGEVYDWAEMDWVADDDDY